VKAYGPIPTEKLRKMEEGGSSNTTIISGGGILPVPARTYHNHKNPAIGYGHRITAFTFLPLSWVLIFSLIFLNALLLNDFVDQLIFYSLYWNHAVLIGAHENILAANDKCGYISLIILFLTKLKYYYVTLRTINNSMKSRIELYK